MSVEKERSARWRVLVVDDEEAARYGMRRALGGYGYEVEEAGGTARLAAPTAGEGARFELTLPLRQ